MTIYKYIGDGAGIPGLPHEITDEEAAERGLSALLQDAIKAGAYKAADTQVRPDNGAPVGADVSVRPNKKKKESEVNDG